jgi:hypothetical protein
MAPAQSKQSSKAEGKKVEGTTSAGVQKKKGKEAPSLSYILLRAMRQSVGIESEPIVGWGLVQGNKKTILVIWYLAKISPTGTILSAPSGRGQPNEYPVSTIQRQEIERGFYAVVDPIPIWATTRMIKPKAQLV